MNDFTKCNKTTGVYWLKQPIADLECRIRIKQEDNAVFLPKLDDSRSDRESLNMPGTEEYVFKWQEKVFSQYEYEVYGNIQSCVTNYDMNYHNMITKQNYDPQRVFTYINNDCYLPTPCVNKKNTINSKMSSCLKKLRLNNVIKFSLNETENSMESLFRSDENIAFVKDEWIAMHIVYDNSKYDGEANLILKEDCLLLSLYYNLYSNYVIISPDVNDISFNPYLIEDNTGVLGLEYGVDIKFGAEECGEELKELLNKLYTKWKKKHKQTYSFIIPNPRKRKYNVAVEIVLAKKFEIDNIYIEYHIKIPDGLECNNPLHGRTQVTKPMDTEEGQSWLYGHTVDLVFDSDVDEDPQPIKIFFEVISMDWWGRHRTEGYSRLSLTLQPGSFVEHLSCFRPCETNDVIAESRRFFIGGCHLIEDLDVLDNANLQDAEFNLVSTGTLTVRWSCVTQTRPTGSDLVDASISLLDGVDAVLRQYKHAKATLAAATRGFRRDLDTT